MDTDRESDEDYAWTSMLLAMQFSKGVSLNEFIERLDYLELGSGPEPASPPRNAATASGKLEPPPGWVYVDDTDPSQGYLRQRGEEGEVGSSSAAEEPAPPAPPSPEGGVLGPIVAAWRAVQHCPQGLPCEQFLAATHATLALFVPLGSAVTFVAADLRNNAEILSANAEKTGTAPGGAASATTLEQLCDGELQVCGEAQI
jgi:hypothetical protein